jgi:hypothetical protein
LFSDHLVKYFLVIRLCIDYFVPLRKYGKNKLKLNIWNNDIKVAIKQNKLAHKQWKEAGKPKRPEHPLLLRKVETRKIYRTEIRKEESKRKHERNLCVNLRFIFGSVHLIPSSSGLLV